MRNLDQVKACLARDKKRGLDVQMARIMSKHGNLTPEAREYAHSYKTNALMGNSAPEEKKT